MSNYLDPKSPTEAQDYEIDWTDDLQDSELISTSTWSVPSGITKDSDEIVTGSLKTRIYLSGGTAGEEYMLTNTVVTDSTPARTYTKRITVAVIKD